MVKSIASNNVTIKQKKNQTGIAARYTEFCKSQENQGILWYLIPLMSLPAAIMPISIFAMSYFSGFIAFVGISILLFFTNIVLTIAEQPTKTKITFYLITVLFHVIVPLITFLFVLFF
ncbi:MAG: hypothetical protein R3A50_04245 [Saprospiraceae bacterium]|nr:hypothetical protein [Bacteroidota bacterium]MCB9319440.1 hypothetical protein [Lewinellaceae bacterium]